MQRAASNGTDDGIVVVVKVSELKTEMDAAFKQVGEQFAHVTERFQQVDQRFQQVDDRFDRVDARFEQVDRRLERIETRLDGIDRRITDEAIETGRHFDVIAEDLKSQMKSMAQASAESERHLAALSREHVTVIAALDDHELRLRVLEAKKRR